MEERSLEERVAVLERTVAMFATTQLKTKTPDAPNWKKIVGVYKDDPEFEEAARLGKEWREAQSDPPLPEDRL